MYLGKTHSEF